MTARSRLRALAVASLVGTLALAACGSSDESGDRSPSALDVLTGRARARAERERLEADLAADQARAQEAAARVRQEAAEEQLRAMKTELEGLSSAMKTLDDRLAATEAALAAAKTPADRDRVAARLADVQRERAELQQRIDRFRAGVKTKCPPDQPLC